MWERCYLGLPTITVVIADNQERTTEDVAWQGGVVYLGRAESMDVAENLRIVRPRLGLPPNYYDVLLGRKVNQDLKKGTAMKWDMVG